MELKIAVQDVPRELIVETEMSPDEVAEAVRQAVEDAVGLLDLTDSKGRRVLVPAARLAFVELGQPARGRVGFGA